MLVCLLSLRYPLDCLTLLRLCSALVGDESTALCVFSVMGGFFHMHEPNQRLDPRDMPCMLSFTHELPPIQKLRAVTKSVVELTDVRIAAHMAVCAVDAGGLMVGHAVAGARVQRGGCGDAWGHPWSPQ